MDDTQTTDACTDHEYSQTESNCRWTHFQRGVELSSAAERKATRCRRGRGAPLTVCSDIKVFYNPRAILILRDKGRSLTLEVPCAGEYSMV
jgi:hypothetical protein